MSIQFNEAKFRELLLYLAIRSAQDPRFGATKLNKLLFYIDFGAYRMFGEPVTGATYQNLPEGPAPRQLLGIRDALIRENDAAMVSRPYFTGTQQRLIAKRAPNLEQFSIEELELIEEVVEKFWTMTAREVSDFSHAEWGWRATDTNQDIQYHTTWFSADPLTEEQVNIGQSVAERHELLA